MRVLIQRVTSAQAVDPRVPNKSIAMVKKGLVCFAGFEDPDSLVIIEQMAQKIRTLRIFSDPQGKLTLSGADTGADYLVASQFTLYADCKYGNRPSFDKAATKTRAKEYYGHFVQTMERIMGAVKVASTPFGSDLHLDLASDGPVTIWLDSREVL
jgi:D-aminoacyl-tRNA deacylase